MNIKSSTLKRKAKEFGELILAMVAGKSFPTEDSFSDWFYQNRKSLGVRELGSGGKKIAYTKYNSGFAIRVPFNVEGYEEIRSEIQLWGASEDDLLLPILFHVDDPVRNITFNITPLAKPFTDSVFHDVFPQCEDDDELIDMLENTTPVVAIQRKTILQKVAMLGVRDLPAFNWCKWKNEVRIMDYGVVDWEYRDRCMMLLKEKQNENKV